MWVRGKERSQGQYKVGDGAPLLKEEDWARSPSRGQRSKRKILTDHRPACGRPHHCPPGFLVYPSSAAPAPHPFLLCLFVCEF
ncbi:Telomere-Associated Protein Rif1 [Manis pentadactyla]|nr:Telomere-Associated Protein Rif1 [Manis pentadactyla]